MKQGLLFANGEVTQREIQRIKHLKFDVVMAADGGANQALQWGYSPDYIIGDLDSITPEIKNRLKNARFVYRPSQDINDLEKALIFCLESSVTNMVILGISGKRLDHTLNNLSVLCRYDRKLDLQLYDAFSQIFIVRDTFEYSGRNGQIISLIPMGSVEGVITEGLAFPLNDEPLKFAVREGLSNYIVNNPVRVKIREGILLVFVHYPE